MTRIAVRRCLTAGRGPIELVGVAVRERGSAGREFRKHLLHD